MVIKPETFLFVALSLCDGEANLLLFSTMYENEFCFFYLFFPFKLAMKSFITLIRYVVFKVTVIFFVRLKSHLEIGWLKLGWAY